MKNMFLYLLNYVCIVIKYFIDNII